MDNPKEEVATEEVEVDIFDEPKEEKQAFLDVESYANNYRDNLKALEDGARSLVEKFKVNDISGNKGEVIAQAMLAIRHIEDARMRFGKVIQYSGDGISKFDK